MENRKTNPENKSHQLKGYGEYYNAREASLALAIADAIELLLEKYDVQITKKDDENISINP